MTVEPGEQRHEGGQAVDEADQRTPAGRLAAAEQHEQGDTERRERPPVVRRERERHQGTADRGTGQPRPEPSRAPARGGGAPVLGSRGEPAGRSARHRAADPSRTSEGAGTPTRADPEAGGDDGEGRAATVQRARRSRGADCRRRGVRGADPRDGSGPGPPFGPTSSGWLPDRAPLSTGRSGPSRVSPARLSLTRATTAIGPGTRTALAHCAVPGPTPARDCRGGSSWWVSCDGRRSPWWSEGLLSTPP